MSTAAKEPTARPATSAAGSESASQGIPPKLWQVVLAALIAIAFTAAFLGVYKGLNKIWTNNWTYVIDHRWIIPIGVLFFSLLVGLTEKHLRAPNVINGGFAESMKGDGAKFEYRTFPGALLSSFL